MHGIVTGMIRYFESKANAEFEHHVYEYRQAFDLPLYTSHPPLDE